MKLLTETYEKEIAFSLSCFDRLIITSPLTEISYGAEMISYLYQKEIKIFDYAKFAEPFREQVRVNSERIAKEEGLSIEFIGKSGVSKEFIISKKIEFSGNHQGRGSSTLWKQKKSYWKP